MRILLITADEATAEAIGRGLEGRGHTIDPAPTSATGLARASLHAYDAIVIDPAVPGRDALDSAAALHGRGGRVPVLALSRSPGVTAPASGSGRGATTRLALWRWTTSPPGSTCSGARARTVPGRDPGFPEGMPKLRIGAFPPTSGRRSSRGYGPC